MEELTKTEARQGVNRGVRYILVASLILAVVAIAASALFV